MDTKTFTPDDSISAIIDKFRNDLGQHRGPFGLLVQFQVHHGVEAQVLDHFRGARPPSLQDLGCLAFEMSSHAVDPSRFSIYERWNNLEGLHAHLHTPHASNLRDALNRLIKGHPEFSVLIPAHQ